MKRTWIPIVVLLLVSAVVAFNLLREPKEDAHAEGIKPKPFALTNKAQPKKHLSSVHASKSEVENAGRLLENRLDEEAFQDMEMPLSEIEIRKKEWFDQEKKVRDEAYEALALSHQSEPRDNRWASEAESELDTILSKLTESQNGISIIGSNCRSTMCRSIWPLKIRNCETGL